MCYTISMSSFLVQTPSTSLFSIPHARAITNFECNSLGVRSLHKLSKQRETKVKLTSSQYYRNPTFGDLPLAMYPASLRPPRCARFDGGQHQAERIRLEPVPEIVLPKIVPEIVPHDRRELGGEEGGQIRGQWRRRRHVPAELFQGPGPARIHHRRTQHPQRSALRVAHLHRDSCGESDLGSNRTGGQ